MQKILQIRHRPVPPTPNSSVLLERLPDERQPGLVGLGERRPPVHAQLLPAKAGDPQVPVPLQHHLHVPDVDARRPPVPRRLRRLRHRLLDEVVRDVQQQVLRRGRENCTLT